MSKSNVHGTVTECLNDFHNSNVVFCVVSCKDTQSLELKLYRVVLVSHCPVFVNMFDILMTFFPRVIRDFACLIQSYLISYSKII